MAGGRRAVGNVSHFTIASLNRRKYGKVEKMKTYKKTYNKSRANEKGNAHTNKEPV